MVKSKRKVGNRNKMLLADRWKDFELIDSGNGEKLERWGKYVFRRPDPQTIWPYRKDISLWDKADGTYHRSPSGGGSWEFKTQLPDRWSIHYDKLSFYVKPMGFKHTGLFPEQAVNWDWIIEKIKASKRHINVLNLFAYTGGATVASAYAGADVCHVDSSKGMVTWAKNNLQLSELQDHHVRFIVDDVVKFVQREKRRGRQYDAVIMDPPSYGRGTNGEVWKIEDQLYDLICLCMDVLSEKPLFFMINSYTTGLSPTVLKNILTYSMGKKYRGMITSDEIGLPSSKSDIVLPCGAVGRWED